MAQTPLAKAYAGRNKNRSIRKLVRALGYTIADCTMYYYSNRFMHHVGRLSLGHAITDQWRIENRCRCR